MNKCKLCGHPEGDCESMGQWEHIGCLKRQLAAANERAGRMEKALVGLCEHLDNWWYEADPMGDVKKGERHPWTKAAREALEVRDDDA